MPEDTQDVNKSTTIVPASSESASAPAAPAASATATPTPASNSQPESKPSSPAAPSKPGKTKREALIKQLTNSTTESDVAVKPTSTPEAPTETATAVPAVEPTVAETPGTAAQEPAGSTTPAATAPEDLELQDEDPSEVEVKRYSPNAQKRIRQLAGKVRDMQPVADFGHDLLVQLKANGIPPDEFRQWTDLGIKAVNGDPAVGEHLYNMAIRAGYTPPEPPQPQLAVEDAAWIKKQIDDGAITPDAGIALAKKLAKTAPAPAPRQQAARPPVPARTQQAAPQVNPQAREAAVAAIGSRAKAFESQYPADWAKLQPTIASELKKYQGNPPESWPAIFTAVVEKVIAEARKAPSPTTTPSLRPGASSAPAVTQFKTERERTIHELSK